MSSNASSSASSSAASAVSLLIGAAAGTLAGFLLARAWRPRPKAGAVKHVFLGRFKDGTTDAEIQALVDGYSTLPKTIKTMRAFEWGTNVSLEGLDKGFTHVFVTTFDNGEGVDHYLKHEDHIKFAQEILGHVADVVVVDYVPNVVK